MVTQKTIDKIPPQSLEAETAVLGSMLLDREAIARAIEVLTEESFYSENNRRIYQVIVKLYDQNRGIDIVTMVEELKKQEMLDEVGGASFVADLANAIPTSANIEYYAKIVREKYLLRTLISTATQIISESYDASISIDELLDRSEKLIFEITSAQKTGRSISEMKDIVKGSIAMIDKLYQKKENVTGVASGFHDLDIMTAGFQRSDLIVVAGRPSMGKSAFATSMVEYIGVVAKTPCVIFSLEMSKEQLAQRMLCSIAKVNAHKVRTGFLSQSDWPKLVDAAQKLSEAPILIDDTAALSVLEMRAKCRRLKAQHDIQFIVLDYLQLMRSSSRKENRQQEITEISWALKSLARELDVPIIAISQLSRAAENREDHKPRLSDLRESGAIEQDADVVLLLFREEYYTPTDENAGVAEVVVAKQRNGPVGDVKLAFLKEFTKFTNLARLETEEGF
ncbi:MAG: replicative DNA helicase [Candidatus Omnitrophica bacterium]|nr:replicative DNA helicase [Candidatus Omnitrophota bacterium]